MVVASTLLSFTLASVKWIFHNDQQTSDGLNKIQGLFQIQQ